MKRFVVVPYAGPTVVLLVCLVLLSSLVSAEEEGFLSGIIKSIMSFIRSLTGGSSEVTTTTLMCTPPYIQVGSDCCLDANGNYICDADETTTLATTIATMAPTTVPTTLATTTLAPTTTTTTIIVCTMNSDCGEQVENRVCYQGDVYLKRISPLCKKPGTAESNCMQKESWASGSQLSPQPLENCATGCSDGNCN